MNKTVSTTVSNTKVFSRKGKAFRIYGRDDIKKLWDNAGLHLESFKKRDFCRLYVVIRKIKA